MDQEKENIGRRKFLKLATDATKRTAVVGYGLYGMGAAGIFAAERAGINYLEDAILGEFRTTIEQLELLRQIVERDIGVGLELLQNEIPNRLNLQSQQLQAVYTSHQENWRQLGIVSGEELQALEQIITNLHRYEEAYTQWDAFQELFDRVSLRVAQAGRAVEERLPGFVQDMHDSIHDLSIIGAGSEGERNQTYERLDALVQVYDDNRDNMLAQEAVIRRINEYLADTDLSPEEREMYNYLKETMEESHRRGNVNDDVREFIQNYRTFSEDLREQQQLQRLQEMMGRIDQVFDQYVPTVELLQQQLNEGTRLREQLRAYDAHVDEAGTALAAYQERVGEVSERMDRLKEHLEALDIRVNYEPDFELGIPVPRIVQSVLTGVDYLATGATIIGLAGIGLTVRRWVNKKRGKEAHRLLGEEMQKNEELERRIGILEQRYAGLQGEHGALQEKYENAQESLKNPEEGETGGEKL